MKAKVQEFRKFLRIEKQTEAYIGLTSGKQVFLYLPGYKVQVFAIVQMKFFQNGQKGLLFWHLIHWYVFPK